MRSRLPLAQHGSLASLDFDATAGKASYDRLNKGAHTRAVLQKLGQRLIEQLLSRLIGPEHVCNLISDGLEFQTADKVIAQGLGQQRANQCPSQIVFGGRPSSGQMAQWPQRIGLFTLSTPRGPGAGRGGTVLKPGQSLLEEQNGLIDTIDRGHRMFLVPTCGQKQRCCGEIIALVRKVTRGAVRKDLAALFDYNTHVAIEWRTFDVGRDTLLKELNTIREPILDQRLQPANKKG